jgi:hypothetical protein
MRKKVKRKGRFYWKFRAIDMDVNIFYLDEGGKKKTFEEARSFLCTEKQADEEWVKRALLYEQNREVGERCLLSCFTEEVSARGEKVNAKRA